ncbi:phage head closure protein [Flavobacteriales bacterium]|nr:phage head closure protein [Flavobacteriales bacterium]
MNIGRLDQRVEHHIPRVATDEWNHTPPAWQLNDTVWATVTFRGGTERQVADQRVNIDRVVFTIRFRDDVTVNDRIKWEGSYHDIHSVEIIGRREGLRLITTARDNAISNL